MLRSLAVACLLALPVAAHAAGSGREEGISLFAVPGATGPAGGVTGPSSTTIGDCAIWSNALGTLLGQIPCPTPGGTTGQIEYNNSGVFGGFTPGGDVSFVEPNFTVVGLQGRPVSSASPSSTNVLTWNGSMWAPAAPSGVQGPGTTIVGSVPIWNNTTGTLLNDPSVIGLTKNFDGSGLPGILVIPATPTLGNDGLGLNIGRATAGATDVYDFNCLRNANYTGGGVFVNSCISAKTIASAGANAYEWTAYFEMDDAATAAGGSQNVAMVAHTLKTGSGSAWGGTFQMLDRFGDPVGGTSDVVLELGMETVGNDSFGSKSVLHVVANQTPSDSNPEITAHGINITSDASNTIFADQIQIGARSTYGIISTGIGTATNSVWGPISAAGSKLIYDLGHWGYGIDLHGATYTSNVGLWIADNNNITFSTDATISQWWNTASNCINYTNMGTPFFSFCKDGILAFQQNIGSVGSPPSGQFYLFVDTASGDLKAKGPSGTVTVLAVP